MYKIDVLISDVLCANCYLVYDESSFLIIDPCVSFKKIEKLMQNKDCKGILITHCHIDHISHLQDAFNRFGANIYVNKNGINKIKDNELNCSNQLLIPFSINIEESKFVKIVDRQIIDFGFVKVEVVNTPGHTSCSVCFAIENDLFTGDTLFNRSVGRTDLATGNSFELSTSIKKLFSLKKDYIIYPGHDEMGKLYNQLEINQYVMKYMNT